MVQFIDNGPEFGTTPIAVGRDLSGMLECTGSKMPFPKWCPMEFSGDNLRAKRDRDDDLGWPTDMLKLLSFLTFFLCYSVKVYATIKYYVILDFACLSPPTRFSVFRIFTHLASISWIHAPMSIATSWSFLSVVLGG
jgi:hypothetical protein